jgi:uncharacterized protein HemX
MKTLNTALAAALVLGSSFVAFAQHEQHQGAAATKAKQAKQAQKAPTMAMCMQMMAEKHKAMTHMKDMETKLDGLVADMERASGENKVNATSAVVSEMVAQQKMHAKMPGMDPKMMGHMMQHSKAGTMESCPMMKGKMGGG